MQQDPRQLNLEKTPLQLQVNTAGVWSAVMRSVFDMVTGSLGQATFPEWRKALELKEGKERQAFQLIAASLIETSQRQLHDRINQMNLNENKQLTHDTRHLRFEIFEGLKNNNYTFHSNDLTTPVQIDLLSDFLPFYKAWLQESFAFDEKKSEDFAVTFRERFTHVFLSLLTDNGRNYADLIAWCNNPQLKVLADNAKRTNYRAQLREHYHRPALGEPDVTLSDLYTRLDFKVYQRSLVETEEATEPETALNKPEDIFQKTRYKGSIHDWFLKHFLKQKPSKTFTLTQPDSRLLLLLGQPGHGKSSFCYRCLHDLLSDSSFLGEAFFVKLNEADKSLLHEPLEQVQRLLPYKPDFDSLFDKGKTQPVVLFMDGLDEMYMAQSLSDRDVSQLLNNCRRLTERHPNLFFVFTSRFNYVETAALAETEAIIMALDNLKKTQQEYMIDAYKKKKGLAACNLEQKVLADIRKKSHYEHIKELIELPILLQMILISNVRLDEQSSRAKIYDELFTTVLNRKWSKDERLKKAKDNNTFKPQHLRSYLSYLAYEIFRSKNNYLHRHEIEDFPKTESFKKRFLKNAYADAEMKDVLKDILTSFYLKETKPDANDQKGRGQDAEYAVEFLHKSLYEYLACEHIWERLTKFFLKDEEDFEDYTFKQVIAEVQDIFALFRFTKETAGYLVEILNEVPEKHELLQKRMADYLPRLVKHGFLHSYSMPENKKPPLYTAEQQALHGFYGYWMVLSNLRQAEINLKYKGQLREHPILETQVVGDKLKLCMEEFGTLLKKLSVDGMLHKVIFSHHDFEGIDFSGGNFFMKRFFCSNLAFANLCFGFFPGVDFSGANLQGALFGLADLRAVDFKRADLGGATLRSANLQNVRVDSENWIAKLKSKNVKDAEQIEDRYYVKVIKNMDRDEHYLLKLKNID